ncbi:hypothetical protein BRE01_34980 [Brevibacillus reuszeri]|uniref:Uncharacterized protein n=1 Tax=Brevibacillus reuszeri TaxID=54915 RepID=A0ABQ0TPN5_9BACL|nr:hypothetical protein BRE01_34980 [Brevibacillus reuszeri]
MPNAWEAAKPAITIPDTLAVFAAGNRAGIEAQTCGAVNAALTPAKKRNKNIVQNPVAKPHKMVEIEKQTMPENITFLRSHPSESGPAIRANMAYPNAYAPTIQPAYSVGI